MKLSSCLFFFFLRICYLCGTVSGSQHTLAAGGLSSHMHPLPRHSIPGRMWCVLELMNCAGASSSLPVCAVVRPLILHRHVMTSPTEVVSYRVITSLPSKSPCWVWSFLTSNPREALTAYLAWNIGHEVSDSSKSGTWFGCQSKMNIAALHSDLGRMWGPFQGCGCSLARLQPMRVGGCGDWLSRARMISPTAPIESPLKDISW